MAEKGTGIGYIPGFIGNLFVSTDFESHTHEQLRAMIASANPDTLKDHADKLTDAAKTIKQIGEDLKVYVRSVDWKGEAGTAFETWGEQAWAATIKLGEYSETGGTWMSNAAQTLQEVKKALPEIDTAAKENLQAAKDNPKDTDAAKVRTDAQAKLDEDHAEAVQQMRKLAQSYTFSSMFINAAEPPVFPPPPGDFVPTGRYDDTGQEFARPGGYAGGGGSSGGGYYSGSGQSGSGGSGYVAPSGGGAGTGSVPAGSVTPPASGRPVDMEIDSVTTLPPTTQPPTVTPPNGPAPTVRPDLGTPPTMMPPVIGGRGLTGPTVMDGRTPTGSVRQPTVPGQGGLNNNQPRSTPRDGISGGRPVPQSGRPTGLPRSTAIGNEGPHGRPMTGGGGMHNPMGGQNGTSAGRRLAYEGGGMVGGRGQQPGSAVGRPFTPGGTGLVRGASEGGSRSGAVAGRGGMPHTGQGSARRQEEQGGQRPDYLTEDEETWQQGGRRIVPPVID
ncbi:WXG100 family type VII secretion target [Streptomyces sp. SP18CS02]|uniref:WXG100 family type VII secretion target n=1 Tax=Streptomyces sp. SP18CS02 TaxID=3002531 RepID=UPI002E784879|nr:hypothetical protein [Streptomyces sp. SP18CS02]MEE1752259.1 hypothetical protein [Streptomyces sp. SP18CS02]